MRLLSLLGHTSPLQKAWIQVLQISECKTGHAVLRAPQRKSTFYKFNQFNIC